MRTIASRGFTLLELILAVALAAMVMGLLAVGTNVAVRDWERAENRLEQELDIALGLLQLEQALVGAYPHRYRDPKENKPYIYFEGKEKSLTWVSTVAPDRAQGLTAWMLERGKDGRGVEVRITPAHAGDPTKNLKKAKPIPLFADYKMTLEYLEINDAIRHNGEGKHRWVKKWEGKKRQGLPRAVRLVLEAKSGRKRDGLELDVMILAPEHEQVRPVLVK